MVLKIGFSWEMGGWGVVLIGKNTGLSWRRLGSIISTGQSNWEVLWFVWG